jgi:quercetin dioxygenase-like cupin family protein
MRPDIAARPDSLALLAAASVWFLASGCSNAGLSHTESLHWSVPPVLPPGALISVVRGDPTRPGPFTLLVSMPNGYRIPPHSHPSYEHVEVKEGTLQVGTGDQLDPKMTQALAAGDSATAPAGMNHFSIAKGRTLLSVTFMGPYTITYVRAEDAPQPRSFPFGY